MTDTQESVVVNQTTNGQIFGFIRILVNNNIAPLYKTIAAVVVLGAALLPSYHLTRIPQNAW